LQKEGVIERMKVWERLISLLAGIILVVLAVTLTLLAFGQAGPTILEELVRINDNPINLWALEVAIIALILAVFLIQMALRMRREEKTVIYQTQFGEIRITVSAIENLALRACKKVRGVRDAHVGVRADKLTGLDVYIEVTASPDMAIPQIKAEIESKVSDYIFETVGMHVNAVKVLVTKIAAETRTRVE
jgi:uncharacterized alkaline shock family protein YloU